MRDAARALVGEHDFSAFSRGRMQAKTPVRTVHAIAIEQHADEIDFVIRANAFLQHMVRNIVGCLVYVGGGKAAPRWIARGCWLRATATRRRPHSRRRACTSTAWNTKQNGVLHSENARQDLRITRTGDARAAAEAGADAIRSRLLSPSPRYLSVERAVEIRDALPPFVQTGRALRQRAWREIAQVIGRVHPAMLQFHGERDAAVLRAVWPAPT